MCITKHMCTRASQWLVVLRAKMFQPIQTLKRRGYLQKNQSRCYNCLESSWAYEICLLHLYLPGDKPSRLLPFDCRTSTRLPSAGNFLALRRHFLALRRLRHHTCWGKSEARMLCCERDSGDLIWQKNLVLCCCYNTRWTVLCCNNSKMYCSLLQWLQKSTPLCFLYCYNVPLHGIVHPFRKYYSTVL
jgi:hypothetical protein